jgi:hypothetical protein
MNNDNHASCLISKFSSYLRQGFLCDVIFICNKRRIIAHRLIVSILSDYFNIIPDIFEKFIIYAYEGKSYFNEFIYLNSKIGHLDIHSNNVKKILDTAHTFHINEVVEICSKFIKKNLQISNCLSLHRFALQHNLQDLTQFIWNYILVCFSISLYVNISLF